MFFLKPNTVIVADDLAAKDKSRFEWLLNASEKLIQMSTRKFKINRNSVRVFVQAILPEKLEAEISNRKIKASNVKNDADVDGGVMKTLNLSVDGLTNTKFLVVLSILENDRTAAPVISFKNNRIKISRDNNSWQVLYNDVVEDTSDPILIVENPGVKNNYYQFIRKNGENNIPDKKF